MTVGHGYCSLYSGTVSTTGTQVVMRTPKYRIIPVHDDTYTVWELQVKRWWGWKTLERETSRETCEATIKHLNSPAEYYDKNGNKIES